MPDEFKPNAREQLLIEEAAQRVEHANRSGHYAPAELVVRMTSEGMLTDSTHDIPRAEQKGLEQTVEPNSLRPGVPEARQKSDARSA